MICCLARTVAPPCQDNTCSAKLLGRRKQSVASLSARSHRARARVHAHFFGHDVYSVVCCQRHLQVLALADKAAHLSMSNTSRSVSSERRFWYSHERSRGRKKEKPRGGGVQLFERACASNLRDGQLDRLLSSAHKVIVEARVLPRGGRDLRVCKAAFMRARQPPLGCRISPRVWGRRRAGAW